jgi:hypothetical protein
VVWVDETATIDQTNLDKLKSQLVTTFPVTTFLKLFSCTFFDAAAEKVLFKSRGQAEEKMRENS